VRASASLELPQDVQERLDELESLSQKAEKGDKEARRELKRALRASAPQVIARASDIGRRAQHILVRTAAAGDPLVEEALKARLDVMREEISGEAYGEEPTPLEALLTERVVSCWMLVELLEVLNSAYYVRDLGHKRVDVRYFMQMVKILDSAYRRFLASIQALARVRKLQANTPGAKLQFNTQINVR
jgi:hypothetical protein